MNVIKTGFEREETQLRYVVDLNYSSFHNRKIVFTGGMSVSRYELEKQARLLGICVAKSVSSKTDFLIIGENVGQSKMNDAKKHKVEIMTESEYLKKLNT